MDKIEQFVVLMYEKESGLTRVNEARQRLYSQSCRLIENIPPAYDALQQHILCAVYQAGVIWGHSLHRVIPHSNSSRMGMARRQRGEVESKMDNTASS